MFRIWPVHFLQHECPRRRAARLWCESNLEIGSGPWKRNASPSSPERTAAPKKTGVQITYVYLTQEVHVEYWRPILLKNICHILPNNSIYHLHRGDSFPIFLITNFHRWHWDFIRCGCSRVWHLEGAFVDTPLSEFHLLVVCVFIWWGGVKLAFVCFFGTVGFPAVIRHNDWWKFSCFKPCFWWIITLEYTRFQLSKHCSYTWLLFD